MHVAQVCADLKGLLPRSVLTYPGFMDPSVVRLIAAAQLVRESHDATDEVWTAAHEVLYQALAAIEGQLAPAPPPAPTPARRRPHWTNELSLTTPHVGVPGASRSRR